MANEWYVQHGGKQYGPLTPANLKKLATDGKITPATTVRLGPEGNWVPASRVQGLFAPASPSAMPPTKAKAPERASVSPQAAKVAAPPVAPPPPPPLATPMARPALGSFGSAPKAAPAESGLMAAKILGAVALVLGTLALATFWLPWAGATAMGWIGIVVGALGLLLGVAGLVLAAMQNGSGLYLNIAGTSSSVVGLVLTVVFGVLFGLFTSAPPKVVVSLPIPRPVVPLPEPEAPPPAEPEPEPEPEPVWTPASESIQQGDIKASITSVKIEQVRLESSDLSRLGKQKPQPMLKIQLTLENTSRGKIIEVPGWTGGGGLIPKELEAAVSALSPDAQAATATATLVDDSGNNYKQTPTMMLFGNTVTVGKDNAVRPGKSASGDLVFPPPLETIEYLRLELSPAGFSGSEPLRFQIPKEMIKQLAN